MSLNERNSRVLAGTFKLSLRIPGTELICGGLLSSFPAEGRIIEIIQFRRTSVGKSFLRVALGVLFQLGALGKIGTLLAVDISSFLTCFFVFRTSNIHTAISKACEYPPCCLTVRRPVRFSTLGIECPTRALFKF
jgi:hypothetical protein